MSRPTWFFEIVRRLIPSVKTLVWLTRVPGLSQIANRLFFEDDNIILVPRRRLIPVNGSLELPEHIIVPSQVVEHFIREAEYHWIMNTCLCRDALHCKDYPIDLGCLFLGEAVLDINPKVGRLVSRDEALDHLQRCREAGLVHMIGRDKFDTVWLGVGPGEKLLTICNCCPCCCLWRLLPRMSPSISSKVTRFPGLIVEVTDQCIGCGGCTEGVCFIDAIAVADGRAIISDECRGCGRCADICPQDAIKLSIEGSDSLQEAIDRISKSVYVTDNHSHT